MKLITYIAVILCFLPFMNSSNLSGKINSKYDFLNGDVSKMYRVKGKILHAAPSGWSVKIMSLTNSYSLNAVAFISPNVGFITEAKGALFVTRDYGENWLQLVPNDLLDLPVSRLLVTPISVLAIHTQQQSSLNKISQLISSTHDAGLTWENSQIGLPHAKSKIYFCGENTWLAINDKVYLSEDNGNRWTGYDDKIANDSKRGSVVDAYCDNPKRILLLEDGKVLISNEWDKWRLLVNLSFPIGGYYQVQKIKLSNKNFISIITSTDSKEGIWGNLYYQIPKLNHWRACDLMGVKIFDSLIISENEILIVGAMKNQSDTKEMNDNRNGVILYSMDQGNTWEEIYRSNEVGAINAITQIDKNQYWAVGENGTVFKILR